MGGKQDGEDGQDMVKIDRRFTCNPTYICSGCLGDHREAIRFAEFP